MPDTITIKKGLDLPIQGEPEPVVGPGNEVGSVALLGDDYVGTKPSLLVAEGDAIRRGQTLFVDRKRPDIRFVSPAGGTVRAVHRGAKRRFLSVVIDIADDEPEESFLSADASGLANISEEKLRDNLALSGLWTSFRTRPYNRIPDIASTPKSIFVTAVDTNPLAMDPAPHIRENDAAFKIGLAVLERLGAEKIFVCCRKGSDLEIPDLRGVVRKDFSGPHPSGLPGTHIHFLDPASEQKVVWFLNSQDCIAIGELFLSGRLPVARTIAIGGPAARKPRLVRTRLGASLDDLLRDEIIDPKRARAVSGSVLSGRTAAGPEAFLGKFHLQLSLLPEGNRRDFLNWVLPGFKRFSIRRAYVGSIFPGKRFAFSTSKEGSERAMVPIGVFESVMPLDILPTFLLRALVVGDNDQAQDLGCLELDEEDLALCSFVCPGKTEYGPLLRRRLEEIEKDG